MSPFSGRPVPSGAAVLALLAVVATTAGAVPPADATDREEPDAILQEGPDGTVVYRVPVTGTIEMGLAPFVGRSLREAAEEDGGAVILDIDTPGGRVDAAWEIIDDVRDAEVPVYAYVNRRALSAGAMIALSAERLYLRPGSVIGAATPVTGEGQRASEKMVSAMRSEFRALAEERGFDPRIAEAMVDENVDVEGAPEGQLLTLTTEEALARGVATGQVPGYVALLEEVGLAGARSSDRSPNWTENVVRFLTNPIVAPFLLSLGFLGLLIEIKTPTFGLAGGAGILSLAAFFGARLLVNLAGMEVLLLVGAGVVLLAVEVFVVPGFGVPGGLGLASILGGVFLSLLGRFPSGADMVNAGGVISAAILIVAVVAFAIIRHLPHSRSLSGIFLRSETDRDTGYLSAPHREELVGRVGVAATDLRPSGTAVVGEERIDVVSEGPWVERGTAVKIVRAESYRHVVRPAEGEEEAEAKADERIVEEAARREPED